MSLASLPSQPQVSVVMPYYENQRTLIACLSSFSQQSLQPCEIIVVDDGSRHAARALVEARHWPVPIRVFDSPHGGQSKATNIGIAAARGDLQLLTCADIIADTHLLERHVTAHAQSNDALAVMGNLPYAKHIKMTPFMRWLCLPARQFSFSMIQDPEHVSPRYCYAPNISIASRDLHAVGGFDEKFVYGYQDTDLGLRLEKVGLRFVYRADAIGYHDHPNSVRAFARRQQQVGEATLSMLEKYPDAQNQYKFQQIVVKYHGFVQRLAGMLDDIEKLEARFTQLQDSQRRLPRQLIHLYDFTMVIAMVEGILQHPDRLRQTLGLNPETTPAPRLGQNVAN